MSIKHRIVKCALIAVLLTVNLPANMAEFVSITQVKEQTAQGWHKTYQSQGRSIAVDIPVQVPPVEKFPLLSAVPVPLSSKVTQTDGNRGTEVGTAFVFNTPTGFRWDNYQPGVMAQAAAKAAQPPSRSMDTPTIIRRLNQLEPDTPYAYGNPATAAQAQSFLYDKWAEFFPEQGAMRLEPRWIMAYGPLRKYDEATGEYSGEPWPEFDPPLQVYFDQYLHDIPVLGFAVMSFATYTGPKKEETRNFLGAVAILQQQDGIGLSEPFLSAQFQLVQEVSAAPDDLPLCSFEKALSTYEELIAQGQLRSVDSLRLGYIAWYEQKEATSFLLLPTWVLEGELYKDAKQKDKGPREHKSFGTVLVNAQTGELINPWNSSPNRAYKAPPVKFWP